MRDVRAYPELILAAFGRGEVDRAWLVALIQHIQANALDTAAALIAEAALEHRRHQSRAGLRICDIGKAHCEDFGCSDLLALADKIRTLGP